MSCRAPMVIINAVAADIAFEILLSHLLVTLHIFFFTSRSCFDDFILISLTQILTPSKIHRFLQSFPRFSSCLVSTSPSSLRTTPPCPSSKASMNGVNPSWSLEPRSISCRSTKVPTTALWPLHAAHARDLRPLLNSVVS